MLIFIVEDDKWYADLLEYQLQLHPDYEIVKYRTGAEMLENLHRKPDIISLDYRLPDIKGDVLMDKIKAVDPDVYIIIVSGQEDISLAVDLLRRGAYDYIVKNKDARNRFRKDFVEIEERKKIKDEITLLKSNFENTHDWEKLLVGKSNQALKLIQEIKSIASSPLNFCISGEKGIGVDKIIHLIHENSLFSKDALKYIDIHSFETPEAIESTLLESKKGLIEAFKGTLVFQNFEDTPLDIQSKIIDALKKIKEKNQFRCVLFGNKPIKRWVEEGKIDTDFYYDFCGFNLKIPPLRERVEDIGYIADQIIYDYCEKNNLTLVKLSKKAERKLKAYHFPGNIDELENVVNAAIVRSNNYIIEENDIIFDDEDEELDFIKKEMPLKDYNAKIIQHFLDKYNYDVLLVAKKLEVGKSTLYRMINKGEVTLKRPKHKSSN